MQFFETRMGAKFFNADIPRLISALETIATALEKSEKVYEWDVFPAFSLGSVTKDGWIPVGITFEDRGETLLVFKRVVAED